MIRRLMAAVGAALIAGLLLASVSPAQPARQASDAAAAPASLAVESDALQRGLEFTAPEIDVLDDFHGNLNAPKLVLYVGGNYFFAMTPLVKAFEAKHPELAGRIYWETIPPGLLVQQIKNGGRVSSGNLTWTEPADVYLAGLAAVQMLQHDSLLVGPVVPYVTNTLTIMVPAGNPAGVRSLADLARPGLRLVMPNPQFEGVAQQITTALKTAGGDALATSVYKTKVASGETVLTLIHHRQTPLFLLEGRAQAGVTWKSEALYQEEIGSPITHIDIPDAQNATGAYAGALVRGAPHAAAGRAWLDFIKSPDALKIFARYGFKPYAGP